MADNSSGSWLSRTVRALTGKPVGAITMIAEPARHISSAMAITDHAVESYQTLVNRKLTEHPGNRELALAQSIGSISMETFVIQGDGHVQVLKHYGLKDGMAVYDLGCGCGRTAQALKRSGWVGDYAGADIVSALVDELKDKCPDYKAYTHRKLSLVAADTSLDMVFHWSVFTHLFPEQCYIYMKDIHRALKPGGKLVFSFLEIESPLHMPVFESRAKSYETGAPLDHLDTFLHRDWIRRWAEMLGFGKVEFTDGDDARNHMPFWQSLVAMEKL